MGTFPSRAALARPGRNRAADVVVFLGAAALLWLIVRVAQGTTAPWTVQNAPSSVATDPARLPYYAARSLLRMFAALVLSVVFTFVYATAAARLRRAEKVLIPLLDVLQSVPILGFLSITVTGFIALFPGSELGLECASIFAIFTSQAWNMTFAFYHSLISQPRELDEAARLLRLSRWQRFWRLDVPNGMIPLVWNGMMSFGGGWFFLTASEALSVNGHQFALPGIGAYVAAASDEGKLHKVLMAIVVMVVLVVGVNVLFWRPLTAWAERFRVEDSEGAEAPRSLTLDLLRRSHIQRLVGIPLREAIFPIDRVMALTGMAEYPLHVSPVRRRVGDWIFGVAVAAVVADGVYQAASYITHTVGIGEVGHALVLGLVTFGRVLVVVAVSTLIWVLVGVWIGMNPRVCRLAQPVVQVLAAFPANFLFPIFTAVLLATGISLNLGGILLMALGAQWYILFNVIAGASAIPNDLREASANLRLPRILRWRRLILPAIFASYVTGGITAAGGAWNASIVAEVVSYHGTTLSATGLGAGVVAFGLFWSTTWARVAAIIIASLSIVSQFLFLPHYPVWAIVVIALDIFVIWAVATWESPAARVARERGVSAIGAQPGSRWPESSQWLGGFPSWPALQPMFGGQLIRLEDGMNDGRYEIRAELPGIDPAKDVDVTARDGVLTIRA